MLEMENKNLPWDSLTQTANFSWCQLSSTLIETLGCLWRWLTFLSVNQVRVWLKETDWSILLSYGGLKKKWQSAVVISQFWSVSEIVIVLFGLYMKFPNHFQLWNWKLKKKLNVYACHQQVAHNTTSIIPYSIKFLFEHNLYTLP